ncbi:MAG: CsgG/HfaB family protein [Armatimonadetes bacterium]|nr:CsgG/HfaB family protein [Armatimonadota bacterium]MDW8154715.1 CsgG/HfaB family protein [Armatimonadota bacterium]
MRNALLTLSGAVVLVLAAWPHSVPAQDGRPVVMVVDFAVAVGWSAASEVVTERIVARLREEGTVRVLSRSETRSALQAARLDLRGILDVADVSRAALRAGADYVVMGEVEQLDQNHTGGCFPIVGCMYTITANVRLRGVVVDAETAMVVARPDGQARGQQTSASVWVGPWWTHVSVHNFDGQLIGKVTLEAVGQFVSRARPALRPKPGRSREAQPLPSTPASGGLERPGLSFHRGSRVILGETFSGCTVRPPGWRVSGGSVECVRLEGRTWLAGVRGETWVERDVPDLEPSRDFALEFAVRLEGQGVAPRLRVYLGRRESPFVFELDWRNNWRGFWAGKPLPDVVGELRGRTRQVAIARRDDMIHVFVDGQRALSDPVDPVTLGRQSRQITVYMGDVDIERRLYVLLTEVVVSQYD